MKLEEQRIAIAQACGWLIVNATTVPDRIWPSLNYVTGVDGPAMFPPVGHKTKRGLSTGFVAMTPPDYLNDLNAMHEAEKILSPLLYVADSDGMRTEVNMYLTWLGRICGHSPIKFASASQCAEAFLLTLNLWKP